MMNKEILKKILKEQWEPLDTAVEKKLNYLQSDDVFDSSHDNDAGYDDSLLAAFGENVKPTAIGDYNQIYTKEQYEEVRNTAQPKYVDQPPSQYSIDEHKRNISARIAALRGLSMPGDYIAKK